ncbi:O-antigen translocase [Halomonas sp. CKK8]|uniref:O-antigen translocase n=1 Tax=Halomonas sp. CKK8 TaxID=3036127 RepID=UPI00241574A3|nr:O-antigen translocase [Halomonas sp. CKK8]WFM69999.1 O-antigen translocase [Halomonas sp. CKK8]
MAARGLIRSMVIIGSAQAVNILLSILRMKVLAVLLGPSGVGLLSIYNNLQGMMSNAAGLGMKSSGVRQIASAKGQEQALSRVRRVLLAAHLVQGVLAMLGIWLLREQISVWLLGDAGYALEIALLGIAILLTLMRGAQTALLQGLRRIGDLGRVTVLGALGGTVVGIVAVWIYGEAGLVWFVLAQPLMGLTAALYFTRRLPKPTAPRPSMFEVWEIWKPMARLGLAFMLGGLATAATLLLVRGRITQELGLDAAGQFAASWGITMTYVGFLLGAMGADYYPRLTEVIHDRQAAHRLMNDQAQLGLAIGGPVLLLLIGCAPWVITLLYSSEFAVAATLLQWQTVGNVFKLASWPLGFSLAAAARGNTFLVVQLNFNILFLAMLWPTLSYYGIMAAGPSFMVAYMLHFALLNVLVYRIHAFRWQRLSLGLLSLHGGLALGLLALALLAPTLAMCVSPVIAAVTGLVGLRIVLSKIGPEGRLAEKCYQAYARLGWPIRSER